MIFSETLFRKEQLINALVFTRSEFRKSHQAMLLFMTWPEMLCDRRLFE